MSLNAGLWIFIFVIGSLLLFAVIGNGLVIYCVLKYQKLRTVTNVLIANLAVSDILLAGFVMPQRLHDLSHEEDFFEGDILCKMVNFCPIFVITSSIYTLVSVSFERRRAIMKSNSRQVHFTDLYKIIPAVWLFGLLVSVPTLIEYKVNIITISTGNNTTKEILSCGSQSMSSVYSITNAVFVVIVSYIMPMITMCTNYIQIACFLVKKGKQIQRAGNRIENMQRFRNRIKVVKLLIVVAVIFAVSWLPFFITLLYAKITNKDASDDASGFVNLFLISLATFSTAYNIVLYVIYNPSFSRAIKEVLRFGKHRVSPSDVGNTNQPTRSEFLEEKTTTKDNARHVNGVAVENKKF